MQFHLKVFTLMSVRTVYDFCSLQCNFVKKIMENPSITCKTWIDEGEKKALALPRLDFRSWETLKHKIKTKPHLTLPSPHTPLIPWPHSRSCASLQWGPGIWSLKASPDNSDELRRLWWDLCPNLQTPGPLHRERGVLATGPPWRSLMLPLCLESPLLLSSPPSPPYHVGPTYLPHPPPSHNFSPKS